jgi:LacI family transcriptional regulator
MAIDFEKPEPLYLQIVDDIQHKITKGKLKVGEQLGSHQKLARDYNVSLITVKKALSNLIDDGLLYSRVGKGTFVARNNSQLILTRHKSIGIVVKNLKSPFFSLITQIVEEQAYDSGYNILLSNTAGVMEKEDNQIKHFRNIGVHGLTIGTASHAYEVSPTIKNLQKEKFPFVMISYVQDPEISFVGTDNEAGAFMATEYLIQKGYQRIGYINGEVGNIVGDIRLKGFLRAHETYNRKVNYQDIFRLRLRGGLNNFQSGFEIGEAFVKLSGRPDAMFCYNDLVALGFQKAVLDAGFRIPEDVALVGFDDIERASFAPVPLTTIHQPTDEIGARTIDMLIKKIEKKPTQSRIILKPELIVRNSS